MHAWRWDAACKNCSYQSASIIRDPQCVHWKTLWHTMPPPLATNSHWTMTWVKNNLLLWQVHELSGFCFFVLLTCLLPWLKLLREWPTQNPWCFWFCFIHDGMFYQHYQLDVRYSDILEADHDKVIIIFPKPHWQLENVM